MLTWLLAHWYLLPLAWVGLSVLLVEGVAIPLSAIYQAPQEEGKAYGS